jgi:uncharacterized membrane protein YfcA
MIPSVSLPFVIPATLIAGIIRTTLGFGAGIFLTASLSLTLEPKFALAVMAFLQIAFDLSAGFHYRGRWNWRLVRLMAPSTLAGVVVGAYFLDALPNFWVRKIMGSALIGYALVQLVRGRTANAAPQWSRAWHGIIIAFFSGVASSLANVSGVILAIYLLSLGISQEVFVGTLTAVQFFQDIFKIPAYWQFGLLGVREFAFSLPFVPVIFLGGWIGTLVSRWISPSLFGSLVLLFILLSGIRLLL